MRFNETRKKKLVKMINDKILSHNERFICYHDHQFLNDQYVFKYSDEHYDIDIILHRHSKFHNDIEIDIHDKISRLSLIFDSHQYFINPKDIRNLIKLLLKISRDRMVCPNCDIESTDHILNENEKGN